MEIKVKTRAGLIGALKQQGFAGPYELESAKAFCAESGIDVPDIDELWAKTIKLTTAADDPGDTDPSQDDGDPATKSAADRIAELEAALEQKQADLETARQKQPKKVPADYREATKGASDIESKAVNHRRISERKQYTAKSLDLKSRWTPGAPVRFFDDADKAEGFKAFTRLAIAGPNEYNGKAYDREVLSGQKTLVTYDNTAGGALVPEDFQATLISLKEVRGAARQVMTFIPMSRDTLTLPRRTAGITTYWPGEGGSITASQPSVDNVRLVANKLACLTSISSELFNDSAISIGDFLAEEIAYGFSNTEDQVVFNGDGTSTYGGFTGIRAGYIRVHSDGGGNGTLGASDDMASLVTASGNAYSEVTLGDFRKVAGKLPAYAEARGNAKWVMHKGLFWEVVMNELAELGGVTMAEGAGAGPLGLLGFSKVWAQVMPRVAANSQVCALLGDFNLACKAGEVRNSMAIATSEHFYFNQDLIAVRGTERFAFTAHDLGNYSATASEHVPGPLIGLVLASS